MTKKIRDRREGTESAVASGPYRKGRASAPRSRGEEYQGEQLPSHHLAVHYVFGVVKQVAR